jgi:hypothetical protein
VDFADRRKAERFIGAIPIVLKQGSGLTRDFSTDGVYFETDQPLFVGEKLDFVMRLFQAEPTRPLRLRCRGEVVRLEPGLEKLGAAVAITKHFFVHEPEMSGA